MVRWLRLALVAAAIAVVLARLFPAAVLPVKLQVAVGLLGWRGLLHTVSENVATGLLGVKTTASRAAWHELGAALTELDLRYLAPDRGVVLDDDIAEGHMLGLHLLATGIDQYAFMDPRHPELRRMVNKDRKWMGDNPDTVYYGCQLEPDLVYVMRGARAGEAYLSITVYISSAPGTFPNGTVSALNDQELVFEADGSYEVTVSRAAPPTGSGNWLQMTDGPMFLVTRHYFENSRPAAVDPAVQIVLDITPVPPLPPRGPPTDADMARRLRWITNFVLANSVERPQMDVAATPRWFSLTPNVIGKPDMHQQNHGGKTGGFGAPDIAYAAGIFKFDSLEEALLVELQIPPCRFANVVLWNRYLQTFNYAQRQISLNRKQMQGLTVDGRVTIVVSATRPTNASVNWLDTEGRLGGTVFIRYVLPQGELQAPTTRLVTQAKLDTMHR